jgi:hypothetical protein
MHPGRLTVQDRAANDPGRLERFAAKRMDAATYEIDSSHVPIPFHPDDVLDVIRSYTMQSTDGPLDSVMIKCPSGHWFNGPLEFLTWKNGEGQDVRRRSIRSRRPERARPRAVPDHVA